MGKKNKKTDVRLPGDVPARLTPTISDAWRLRLASVASVGVFVGENKGPAEASAVADRVNVWADQAVEEYFMLMAALGGTLVPSLKPDGGLCFRPTESVLPMPAVRLLMQTIGALPDPERGAYAPYENEMRATCGLPPLVPPAETGFEEHT